MAAAISTGSAVQKLYTNQFEVYHNRLINFRSSPNYSRTRLPGCPKKASRLSFRMSGVQPVQATLTENSKTPSDLPVHGNVGSPILVIDNYDSFTYNLCQCLGDLGARFDVYRNDELTVEEVKKKNPRGILISPGPGTPHDSGISLQIVVELGPIVPLFGVCMGLQCIGEAFGGNIVRSPYGVMHGKKSLIHYDEKGEDGILAGLSNPFTAARYHSLVIDKKSFPHDELEITAWTDDDLIMGVRHKRYKHIQAVQFHPESIITTEGKKIVQNFINMIERLEEQKSF